MPTRLASDRKGVQFLLRLFTTKITEYTENFKDCTVHNNSILNSISVVSVHSVVKLI